MIAKHRIAVRLLVFAFLLIAHGATNSSSQREAESTSTFVASGIGPHLAPINDSAAVVSYIVTTESVNALRYRVTRNGKWSEAHTVATGENWFVNWADFPSVVPISSTLWAAHWLVRREAGGYAYDAYATVSENAGRTWSKPFLLHHDGTDTEHGFVTLFAAHKGVGAIWLDGRNIAGNFEPSDGSSTTDGMALRAARFDASGVLSDEQVIDTLTCDCCQTDIAISNEGPVAVYRDRSEDEIRDIYISRFVDGRWQEGKPVYSDGWKIAACPVNGPVVRANGDTVVVTWFTAADDRPVVKSAWSFDAGRTFSSPIIVDDQSVIGYIGSVLVADDTIVASWLCKDPAEKNAICFRSVNQNGEIGLLQRLLTPGAVARISVPQLGKIDDQLLFVWTDKLDDQSRINSRRIPLNSIYR